MGAFWQKKGVDLVMAVEVMTWTPMPIQLPIQAMRQQTAQVSVALGLLVGWVDGG